MDNKNMMRNIMKNHEDDIMKQKDCVRMKKQEELDKDIKFLNGVEYQRMLDQQKRHDDKMRLKSDFDNDLERSKHQRHVRMG
jgi:hypothetical protein